MFEYKSLMSNISSKARGPILIKFIETSGVEGTKFYPNSLGHMINISARPIYGLFYSILSHNLRRSSGHHR